MEDPLHRSCSHVPALSRPAFLVQGFASSVRVLGPLERYLRRLGRRTYCPSPALWLGDIRLAALRLHEVIEETAASAPFERADLIGHSMGGLVAAYVLKQLDRGQRVSRVIALGTPFRGLAAARLGAMLLGPFGCSLRQLTPGSTLLRVVERLPVPSGSALVSIAGARDWLVPPEATHLPATPGHVELCAGPFDHWDLLLRRHCFAQIARALEPTPFVAGRGESRSLAA